MFNGIMERGREYLAKCQVTGEAIKLLKVKIGSKMLTTEDNPEKFTSVKEVKQEVFIYEKIQDKDRLKIVVQFNNDGLNEGYHPREIGVYADDEGEEILYWYINDGDEPPASKSPVNFKYTINISVTNLDTLIVDWDGKELFVDREYFDKKISIVTVLKHM